MPTRPGGHIRGTTQAPQATGDGSTAYAAAMSFSVVKAADVPASDAEHPASSPYDRRLSTPLGITRFGLYEVDLPAGATTVPHDHRQDDAEDAYVVVRGSGWLVVDGVETALAAGHAAGVTPEPERWFRAGPDGCTLLAVCA